MSKELRERIAADVLAVMKENPSIAERLTRTGQIVNPGGAAEFAKAIEAQRARIAQAAKLLGVKPKQ
jgi:hypothetical protein